MKTLIKSLALALSLGFATTATTFAEEVKPIGRPANVSSFKVGMFTAADGKLVVMLDKQPGGYVDIQLKDVNGTVLFTQHLGKKDMKTRLKLNLNELADGQYKIEVTNGVETTTNHVTLSTQQPTTPARTISMN